MRSGVDMMEMGDVCAGFLAMSMSCASTGQVATLVIGVVAGVAEE